MGMNGGTGFHHKAVKGKPAGGHCNSSVNNVRSHPCRLSKQYIAEALKGGDGCFLERPGGRFSQNIFEGASRLWTRSIKKALQSNHEGKMNRARCKREESGQQISSLDNGDKTAADIVQRAKQLLLHSLR